MATRLSRYDRLGDRCPADLARASRLPTLLLVRLAAGLLLLVLPPSALFLILLSTALLHLIVPLAALLFALLLAALPLLVVSALLVHLP